MLDIIDEINTPIDPVCDAKGGRFECSATGETLGSTREKRSISLEASLCIVFPAYGKTILQFSLVWTLGVKGIAWFRRWFFPTLHEKKQYQLQLSESFIEVIYSKSRGPLWWHLRCLRGWLNQLVGLWAYSISTCLCLCLFSACFYFLARDSMRGVGLCLDRAIRGVCGYNQETAREEWQVGLRK